MRWIVSTLVGLAALASAFPAHTVQRATHQHDFGCSTEPSDAFLAVAKEMSRQERGFGRLSAANATIKVQTYFHVVAASEALEDGYVTDTMLADQLTVMNSNYAPYGISFSLAGTDKTVDASWAVDGAELAMKKKLRKGDYKALNVYFQKEIGGNLGYCYFPDSVSTGSDDFYYDGCSILFTSLPGGSATNYNEGKTVTHEVGHWFGLFHTFQGNSCSGDGDSIADTPQQLNATRGCPVGRDSCPGVAGPDPIHNYMDYSYDACYEEFTPNQVTRAYNMFNKFRVNGPVASMARRAPIDLDVSLAEIEAGKLD
ncbi:extracellular metalloprotease [Mytilinidion resinicola]|uniref:Extracellular metalloprotease n=1 Tax=Mytilinidion resinicola TaxID=574789 RepID=A0A6A6Z5M6_9PEZI|nr:extracellular metalloprotease [Mytilinidion resinicola]KAF2815557.1 extracellular metalloprotease [Mytilinidion resinicola]